MKRITNWLLAGVLVAGIAGLGTAGCGEEARELYNCGVICESYSDCAGELGIEVDLTECVSSCEDTADRDDDFAQTAQACQECLSEADSCVDSLPCVDECAGVVPEVVLP